MEWFHIFLFGSIDFRAGILNIEGGKIFETGLTTL